MRAFIAIDLEPSIKESLLDLIRSLERTKAEVRWVRREGLHLTIKFLGEIGSGEASKVKDVLGSVAARHRRFRLAVEGTGTFPNGRAPRVFWVGVRPEPELVSLHEGIEAELENVGFPREARSFHPHLTLGRAKGRAFIQEAIAELERHSGSGFGEMEVVKVTFFESLLGPGGARYRTMSEHPLS